MINESGHPVFLLTQHSGDTVLNGPFGGRECEKSAWGTQTRSCTDWSCNLASVSSPSEERPGFAKEIYDSHRSREGNLSTKLERDASKWFDVGHAAFHNIKLPLMVSTRQALPKRDGDGKRKNQKKCLQIQQPYFNLPIRLLVVPKI